MFSNPETTVNVFEVSMIIFADGSALGDRATIDSIFSQRRSEADEYEFWLAKLQTGHSLRRWEAGHKNTSRS